MKNRITHDLHVHLYGCLSASDLWKLAKSKQHDLERVHFFEKEYLQQFQQNPNLLQVIQQDHFDAFQKMYHLTAPCTFLQFQAKFNLIIALCHLDSQQEVSHLVHQICLQHQHLKHVEYRMPIPYHLPKDTRKKLLLTICQVFQKFHGIFQPKLSVSLPRDHTAFELYFEVKQLMKHFPSVQKTLVSVDFCFAEEGHPPKERQALYAKILKDNLLEPYQALAILDHVGEVFSDKSLESAIRWIHQSAMFGTHRLGHALALGMNPQQLLGKQSCESVAERLDQICYELQQLPDWKDWGISCDKEALQKEYDTLQKKQPNETILWYYDEPRLERLRLIQDFVMNEIKKLGKCVESCITSNQMLNPYTFGQQHPILRFLKNEVPVVLGSDDPGLFQTSLQQEENKLKNQFKLSEQALDLIEHTAHRFRSEIISSQQTG